MLNSKLKFKAGLGRGTNNFDELMALKLVLILAAEKGVQKLQIFRDSMIVTN
jgi:ribonuclease HI